MVVGAAGPRPRHHRPKYRRGRDENRRSLGAPRRRGHGSSEELREELAAGRQNSASLGLWRLDLAAPSSPPLEKESKARYRPSPPLEPRSSPPYSPWKHLEAKNGGELSSNFGFRVGFQAQERRGGRVYREEEKGRKRRGGRLGDSWSLLNNRINEMKSHIERKR